MISGCVLAEEDDLSDEFSINLGTAVHFIGPFKRPVFFDSPRKIMMKPYSPEYLHFKTEKGGILQFRLSMFHSKERMLLTSTMEDTFWFRKKNPSISDTMEWARGGMKRLPSKTAYSGYVCWGGYFTDLENRLRKHMDEHNFELDVHSLRAIYEELIRRRDAYGKACDK